MGTGVFTINFTQTNQVEILCSIVKSIQFDVVREQRATQYIKMSLTDQKE